MCPFQSQLSMFRMSGASLKHQTYKIGFAHLICTCSVYQTSLLCRSYKVHCKHPRECVAGGCSMPSSWCNSFPSTARNVFFCRVLELWDRMESMEIPEMNNR